MVDKAKVTMKYYSPFPSGLDTNRQNIKSQVLFPPQASSTEDGIFKGNFIRNPEELLGN